MENQERVELMKAAKQVEKFFNNRNPDDLVYIYTATARIYPPNAPCFKGREAIRKYWSDLYHALDFDLRLDTHHLELLGDTAVEEGEFNLRGRDGSKIDTGNYVVIWKKQDGHWRYDRDIWHSNLAIS